MNFSCCGFPRANTPSISLRAWHRTRAIEFSTMAQRICRLQSPPLFCAEQLGKIYSSNHANFAARRNAPCRAGLPARFTLGLKTRSNLKNRLLFTPLTCLLAHQEISVTHGIIRSMKLLLFTAHGRYWPSFAVNHLCDAITPKISSYFRLLMIIASRSLDGTTIAQILSALSCGNRRRKPYNARQ